MSSSAIAIIILLVALLLFITQRIPSGVVAILGALAMVAFGVMDPSDFCSPFGSDTVIMVASVMILGGAVFKTGAAQLVGEKMMFLAKRKQKAFLPILVVSVGLLSAFLSNTAVVAIFLPLLASLSQSSGGRISKKGTYMATGIAAVVGGNCTLAGSTPQLIAQGILAETDGVRLLDFWEIGKVGFPLLILLAAYYALAGSALQEKYLTFEELPDCGSGGVVQENNKKKQLLVGLIMLACVACFTLGLASFGVVAAASAIFCVLLGCISLQEAFQTVDWNTVCVLGGAMGISNALNKSGAVQSIAHSIIGMFGNLTGNVFLMCAVIIVLSALLGNVMSHTATAAILTPMVITIAQQTAADPIAYVIGVVIGCNLAFLTPVATPPLTMTLIGGYRFTDYFKVLSLYNLLSIGLSAALIPLLF